MDKVDLYQVHMPFPPRHTTTWADAMADAFDAGLIRAVGVSNFSVDQMRRSYDVLAKRGIPLASNQVLYNLTARKPEKDGLLKACQELGVTLIAYSPLAQGLLTGKYTTQHPVGGFRWFRHTWYIRAIQPLIGLMREIGQAHEGKSPAQVAINWVMAKGAVPIPGAKNLRQAQENIAALSFHLSKDEVKALDEASPNII
jgi:aryl-alcohol dehydrogenase-like predicted oxidoreductase